MKTEFILCKTEDLAYRPQCIGQHGHNVRFHVLGMCDILRRSGDTSSNVVWKCELKEVYLNLIKVYGQSLQNILEIPNVYSKMKTLLVMIHNN